MGGGLHHAIPPNSCAWIPHHHNHLLLPHTIGMIEVQQVRKGKTPLHFEAELEKRGGNEGGGLLCATPPAVFPVRVKLRD